MIITPEKHQKMIEHYKDCNCFFCLEIINNFN